MAQTLKDVFRAVAEDPRNKDLVNELSKDKQDQNQTIIWSLINQGKGLEVFNEEGFAPLHLVFLQRNKTAFDALLKKGVNVDLEAPTKEEDGDGGVSLLMSAAYHGEAYFVEKALAYGADVFKKTENGLDVNDCLKKGMEDCHPDAFSRYMDVAKILTTSQLKKGVVKEIKVKSFKGFKK